MKYFTQKWQIHTLMFFQTLYFFHEMQILQQKFIIKMQKVQLLCYIPTHTIISMRNRQKYVIDCFQISFTEALRL